MVWSRFRPSKRRARSTDGLVAGSPDQETPQCRSNTMNDIWRLPSSKIIRRLRKQKKRVWRMRLPILKKGKCYQHKEVSEYLVKHENGSDDFLRASLHYVPPDFNRR